ncbi:hypothetical protein JCM11251_003298 [Rhodosporidiobolus azoricus]
MSEGEALSPAAARAAARREKLLAKGKDRLDKITGTVKGEGRFVNESAGIPPRAPAAATTAAPPAPKSLADVNTDDDPAEIDLASNPLSLLTGAGGAGAAQNPFAAFGGGEGGAPGGDMFSQMMAQMAQQAGGAGGEGAANPFAANAGGAGGAPMANPFLQPPPPPRTFLDRVFPLIHLLAMVGLAVYAVVFLEPARRITEYGWTGTDSGIDWSAWGALLSVKPKDYGAAAHAVGFRQLAEVPLLWLFISIELVLQTSRLFLVRNRPSPPGLLSSVLPLLSQFSPQLGMLIQTGFKYLDLFSTCLNDLAVLIFCIGMVVIVGRYKTGEVGYLELMADKAQEVTNEMLGKATGEL